MKCGAKGLLSTLMLVAAWSPGFAGIRDLGTGPERERTLGPSLVSLDDIDEEGTRRGVFVLGERTPLHVRCVGVADRRGTQFLAYGWILDLSSRHPVWVLDRASGSYDRESENWVGEEDLELPAGTYGVYFAAYGGRLPMAGEIKIFGLELGKIESDVGPLIDWDDEGDSDEWGIWVNAREVDFHPLPVPAVLPKPFPKAVVRELGLRLSERKRVTLDLDRDVDFHLWATGEAWSAAHTFADGSWITDRNSWRRVWDLGTSRTEPAGGGEKNRLFDGEINLPRGSYLVTVVTDDSHATDDWNVAPPFDPDAWGLALTPLRDADRAACRVSESVNLPEASLSIDHIGDNACICRPFQLRRAERLLVRALGEKTSNYYADFGWIEDRATLEPVWEMDSVRSFPAGGGEKNREVETVVALPAGNYNLCFVTDDSHSYDGWNADPPYEPEDWGIRIAPLDLDERDALVTGIAEGSPPTLAIAPVEDDQHIVRKFSSDGETKVRIIAVGEGIDEEMADYGWLENLDTGEVVWEMQMRRTRWAGGAKKNREQRLTLTLPAGRYALHYESDDSHAFGDWNAPPPRQPQLWGVTLIELPEK